MFEVVERHQHLCRGQPFGAEHLGPHLRQRDLPRRSGRLRILERPAPALGEPQPPRSERDRARRDDRNLLARPRSFGNVRRNPDKPVAPHRARRIDEQGRSDLDDQPGAGGGRKQAHGAADSARRA